MKKIIIGVFLLISIGVVWFWCVFIKSKRVVDVNMLTICIYNNQVLIETRESAKFISSVEFTTSKDTLNIVVKTTTILNPFSDKKTTKRINLQSNIKFVNACNRLLPISELRKCR